MYGAIIARAFECGKPPTPAIVDGTLLSHPSSCPERVASLSEYHDPAWVASRLIIWKFLTACYVLKVVGDAWKIYHLSC